MPDTFRTMEHADGVDDEVESAEVYRRASKVFDYVDTGKTVLVRRYAKPRAVIMGFSRYKKLRKLERDAGLE